MASIFVLPGVYEMPTDQTPILPFPSVAPSIQLALLDIVVKQGTSGSEYDVACERLISVLSQV